MTALLKTDSWVRKGDATELFELKENIDLRTSGHKLAMNVLRLEMRSTS